MEEAGEDEQGRCDEDLCGDLDKERPEMEWQGQTLSLMNKASYY